VAGSVIGAVRVSPQRAHAGPLRAGNSVQQASQIGTEERCGRGEPQRVQKPGRRAQPRASMGLRSTRATARQREVSDGGTSNVSEPESLRKTHLISGRRKPRTRRLGNSIPASGMRVHGISPWREQELHEFKQLSLLLDPLCPEPAKSCAVPWLRRLAAQDETRRFALYQAVSCVSYSRLRFSAR
jgi:hypothetical protein